jgi:hypothetical protein
LGDPSPTSHFGKKKDKDGLDDWTGKVLWLKFIETETKTQYQEGLDFLIQNNLRYCQLQLMGELVSKRYF